MEIKMEMEINHVEYDAYKIKGLLRLRNFLFNWLCNKPRCLPNAAANIVNWKL